MLENTRFTNSKRDNILSSFGTLRFEQSTDLDKGYEFLEEGETFITVYNADSKTKLSIGLGERFKLFFGGWQTNFDANEEGYENLLNAVKGIFSSLVGVYALQVDGKVKYELGEIVSINNIRDIVNVIPAFKKLNLKFAKLKLFAWNEEKRFSL